MYDFGITYKNWSKAEGVNCLPELHLRDMPDVTDVYLHGRHTVELLTRTDTLTTLAVVPPSGTKIRVTDHGFQLIGAEG